MMIFITIWGKYTIGYDELLGLVEYVRFLGMGIFSTGMVLNGDGRLVVAIREYILLVGMGEYDSGYIL